MEFYILNQNEEVTATLSTDSTGDHTPVLSAIVDEKLGSYDILELKVPFDIDNSLDIKEEYFIVFKDVKGWREYIINEVVDEDDGKIEKTITAELSSIELLDEIIETNITGNNPGTLLGTVLAKTRWSVGSVDASIYNSAFSEETEMLSALEVIDLLSSKYNAEISFSYAIAGNKITKRFVNITKQIGADNGKRFEVDKDVISIKRTIDTTNLKTAIIPFGAEPEEGKARLSIKDLVWSKSKGDPADKPKGQNWIGNTEALLQWGKNNEDGSRRHRFLSQEIDVETEAELATMAWVMLGKYTSPKTTYEAKAMDLYTMTADEDLKHEYVNLGDTVVITDHYFAIPLVVQTRTVELKRDLIEPLNNDLVFGDSKQTFSVGSVTDRVNEINKDLSNKIELVRASADGKTDSYLGSQEPINPKEGDSWYRPHPTLPNEEQYLIFNGLTWDVILDTSKLTEVGDEVKAVIEQADRDREQAEADFEAAKVTAKAYTDTKATEFDTKVEAVKTDLATTKTRADKAVSDAQTAITEAGFAKVDASTAKQNVVTAITTAETAKTNAATALTAAQTAVSNSGTALTNAQTALNRVGEVEEETGTLQTSYDALTKTVGLKADKTAVDTINQTVTKHTTDIKATSDGLALKSDKSVVDSINSTVNTHTSQIKATSDGLALKADSTLVNTVKGTVDTHTTQIKATSDGLALKAEKSLVDTINSTVGTHTTQIKATSDGLALKAEKSLVDTVKSTVDTHTTQIKATSDGLALKAESSLVNSINGTVNTHTGQISANSTAIAARLTSAQVDSLVAAKKYVNETTFNATANGLSTSITQVSTNLSNLEITDRNLVKDSNKFYGTGGNGAAGVTPSVTTDGNLQVVATAGNSNYLNNFMSANNVLANELNEGDKFTISFTMKSANSTGIPTIYLKEGLGYFQMKGTMSTEFSTIYYTGIWKTANAISFHMGFSGLVGTFIIKDMKIQKGDKATGWTPAVEDMATLEKFTTLEATVNGINTVVGNKADKSQITQLATQVSTKVESATFESRMTQVDGNINLRVSKVQTNLDNLEIGGRNLILKSADSKLLPATTGDYNYFTIISNEIFKEGETYTFSSDIQKVAGTFNEVTVLPRTTTGGGSSASMQISIVNNRIVGTFVAGANVDRLFVYAGRSGSTANKSIRLTNYKLEKGSKATDWTPAPEDMADKATLISQMNVSTEGILLQGKRIQLDGDVTMTSAFVTDIKAKSLEAVYADIATLKTNVLTADVITSTMLKSDTALITKLFATDANVDVLTAKTAFVNSVKAVTISADKITAGTLNASNVNIINMNASNISTGTLTGTNFKLNLSTGQMDVTGSKQTIRLNSGGLTLLNNQNQEVGGFITAYSGANPTVDNGLLIAVRYGKPFTIGRQSVEGSTSYNDIIKIPYNANSVEFYEQINLRGNNIVGGEEIEANRFRLKGTNQYLISSSGGGGSFIDTQKVSLGIGTSSAWVNRLSVGGTSADPWVDIRARLNMQDYDIGNANVITAKDITATNRLIIQTGSKKGVLYHGSSSMIVSAEYGVTISHKDAGGIDNPVMNFTKGTVLSWANINMNGNSITNQSDIRLKKNIVDAEVDGILLTEKQRFIEYEWDETNPYNAGKPEGIQFGLEAQYAGFMSVKDIDSNYLSIDMNKQVNLNTLTNQQIIKRLKAAEEKIKQLESGI